MERRNKQVLIGCGIIVCLIVVAVLLFNSSITGNIILSDYLITKYAPPYDVFNNNMMVFNVSPEYVNASGDLLNIKTNVSLTGGYIYKKGYIFNWQTNSWEIFNFVQTPVGGSYWIKDFASADLIVNASKTLKNGENYIVAYACNKSASGAWQCGCQNSSQLSCARWMLQIFNVSNVTNVAVPIPCVNNNDCVSGNCTMGVCVASVGDLPGSPVVPPMIDSNTNGYIEIHSCEQLQNISNNLSANYELMNNIDCSATRTWNNGEGFEPIGSETSNFIGKFNGNGFNISELYINRTNLNVVGLFGVLFEAEVGNFSIINANIFGQNAGAVAGVMYQDASKNTYLYNIFVINSNIYCYGQNSACGGVTGGTSIAGAVVDSCSFIGGAVSGMEGTIGGIAGYYERSLIINSYFDGMVSGGPDSAVGGIVGASFGTYDVKAIISGSSARGDIIGYSSVGGLIGSVSADTIISDSDFIGNVIGEGSYVAGIVGWANQLVLSNSFFSGVVSGGNSVGGLLGMGDTIIINNSYSLGNVNGGNNVGGLVGGADSMGFNVSINNSYSLGNVNGGNNVGGLMGYSYVHTILSNSYSRGNITGIDAVGGLIGKALQANILRSYTRSIGGFIYSDRTGVLLPYPTGLISGSRYVGGLVGLSVPAAGKFVNVSNSYSLGYKILANSSFGGLIGNSSNNRTIVIRGYSANGLALHDYDRVNEGLFGGLFGPIYCNLSGLNSYFDGTISIRSLGGEFGYFGMNGCGAGKSSANMQIQSTYSGWDFQNTWLIDANTNNGYPYLR
jgi:hypothetical protein